MRRCRKKRAGVVKKKGCATTNNRIRCRRGRTGKAVDIEVVWDAGFNFEVCSVG
jgi:hypothetical protein